MNVILEPLEIKAVACVTPVASSLPSGAPLHHLIASVLCSLALFLFSQTMFLAAVSNAFWHACFTVQVVAKEDAGHNDDWGSEELGDDLLPM